MDISKRKKKKRTISFFVNINLNKSYCKDCIIYMAHTVLDLSLSLSSAFFLLFLFPPILRSLLFYLTYQSAVPSFPPHTRGPRPIGIVHPPDHEEQRGRNAIVPSAGTCLPGGPNPRRAR